MTYEHQKLTAQHATVARLLAEGNSLRDICTTCGLNHSTWVQTTNSELFKAKVAELQAEIEDRAIEKYIASPTQSRLEALRSRAIDVHEDALTAEDPKVALRAATNVLEFSGIARAKAGLPSTSIIINISSGKIENMEKILASDTNPA